MADPLNAGFKSGLSRHNTSAWLDRYGVDAAVAFALFIIAVLIRIPYFSLIPVWADDVGESVVALHIAEGSTSPLVVMGNYLGPAHPDLIALVIKVISDPLVPRAVNLILASLTVTGTYFLGRSLHNRAAGVIAALFLVTSSTHIVVNSHYAYSSSAAPLFTTGACLFLVLAVKRTSVRLLGLASVSLALALQMHPAAIAIAPGLLIWFLFRRNVWSWLRRPGTYLAALAAVITYSPVLYHTFSNLYRFQYSIATRQYAIETNHSLSSYLGNLQNMIVEVLRMLGAHYSDESRPLLYLTDPLLLAFAVLVPLAALVSLRRGRTLAVLALASAALTIPYFNYQYGTFPYFTRYVAFLLPLFYVTVASLAVEGWSRFSTQSLFRSRLVQPSGKFVAGLLVAALIVLPANRTFEYYNNQVSRGATNAPFMEIMQRLDSQRDARVLIDASLQAGQFPGAGNLHRTFRIWFRFQHRPYEVVDTRNQPSAEVCGQGRSMLIAGASAAAALAANCPVVRVLEYKIPTRPGLNPLVYGLYEIGPPGGQNELSN